MPKWLLRAFEEGIPRIEAREAIQAANIASVASSNMKKQDRTKMLNSWRKQANQGVSNVQKPGPMAVAAKFGIPIIEDKPDV